MYFFFAVVVAIAVAADSGSAGAPIFDAVAMVAHVLLLLLPFHKRIKRVGTITFLYDASTFVAVGADAGATTAGAAFIFIAAVAVAAVSVDHLVP